MPIGIYEKDDIDAIAETIRDCRGGGNPMTTAEMPEEIRNVKEYGFSAGYSEGNIYGLSQGREQGHAEGLEEGKTIGYVEGKTDGIAEGRQAQYEESWASSSNSKIWNLRFAGVFWNNTTFAPNHDLILEENCYYCFNQNQYLGDLVELLERLGKTFDTTKATNCGGLFGFSLFTRIGECNLTNVSDLSSTFSNMVYLHTIDKLVISERTTFYNTFNNDKELVNLIVEGVIGQNGFNVQWSTKLSKVSITSVINALSSTTSGLTVTLSKTAVNNAFSGGSTGEEWLNLIATKSNWNISLV